MTKVEAIDKALKDNVKIIHRFFCPGEFLHFVNGEPCTDLNKPAGDEYWVIRNNVHWQISWSVLDETPHE